MFDLNELKTYREGNRLEAKKALGRDGQGELPRSVWETVSAFANTAGGVIVLGVSERKDGSFVVHGIPKVGKVLDDFWNAALSEDKLSARFVKDADATVGTVGGKGIVVIRVPWVDRYTRPVYIDNSIFGGTFRRTHTGDHLCGREEVLSMLRDSDTSSQDAAVAENVQLDHISRETVERYRRRFNERNEGHVWGRVDDTTFLTNIGALRADESSELRPTRAGLLMFGEDRWITYKFPHYFLDYRQEAGAVERWEDRFTSQPGDWTGNVYDFYFRVYNKLKAALKVPFRLDGVDRVDDTPAHEALREAIVNALTNANWFDRRGVVCVGRRGHHHREPRRLPHASGGGTQARQHRPAQRDHDEDVRDGGDRRARGQRHGQDLRGLGVGRVRGAELRGRLRPRPHHAHASARIDRRSNAKSGRFERPIPYGGDRDGAGGHTGALPRQAYGVEVG